MVRGRRWSIAAAAVAAAGLLVLGGTTLPGQTRGGAATESAGQAERADPSDPDNQRAAPRGAKPSPGKAAAKAKRTPPITAESEAAVHAFVKKHHRGLHEVLVRLKDGLPTEYQRALRDLQRTQQRLTQLQQRDSQRYELELRLWQVQSDARLLSARIQMTESSALQDALRRTLIQEHDLRVALLTRDRDRVAERLDKLNQQLDKLKRDRVEAIEKQVRLLSKTSQKREAPTKTRTRKPPSTRSAEKPTD